MKLETRHGEIPVTSTNPQHPPILLLRPLLQP